MMTTLTGIYCGNLQDKGDGEVGKIIGGTPASMGEFPWLVSLQLFGSHYCGASILDKYTILTAAHCTNYNEYIINSFDGKMLIN